MLKLVFNSKSSNKQPYVVRYKLCFISELLLRYRKHDSWNDISANSETTSYANCL
jgi:hypothetical protein